jgi:hypothetical protein
MGPSTSHPYLRLPLVTAGLAGVMRTVAEPSA